MALLESLFNRKPSRKSQPVVDEPSAPSGPSSDQAVLDRKILRLERRELLYAVIRESMARVGVLSSTYKYKVLSLDARGNEYLIMMDLPQDLAGHIDQLASIEETIVESARQRHRIGVTGVYWRIQDLAKASSAVLRKRRGDPAPAVQAPPSPEAAAVPTPVLDPDAVPARGATARTVKPFAPIRPEEVQAFKAANSAGAAGAAGTIPPAGAPAAAEAPTGFEPTAFPSTEFEETRLEEPDERMPLSRTQYGDLI